MKEKIEQEFYFMLRTSTGKESVQGGKNDSPRNVVNGQCTEDQNPARAGAKDCQVDDSDLGHEQRGQDSAEDACSVEDGYLKK